LSHPLREALMPFETIAVMIFSARSMFPKRMFASARMLYVAPVGLTPLFTIVGTTPSALASSFSEHQPRTSALKVCVSGAKPALRIASMVSSARLISPALQSPSIVVLNVMELPSADCPRDHTGASM
jgi:hypothetical protein